MSIATEDNINNEVEAAVVNFHSAEQPLLEISMMEKLFLQLFFGDRSALMPNYSISIRTLRVQPFYALSDIPHS
jgi:hypothetical protein